MAVAISDPGSVLKALLLCCTEWGFSYRKFWADCYVLDFLLVVRDVKKLKMKGAKIPECFDEFAGLLYHVVILDVCHMYREANSIVHALVYFSALSYSF